MQLTFYTDNVTYADLQKAIRFFPSPVQMACLLCMTAHALAFEPATILEDKEGYECPASIYMMRKTSRDRARRLLDWFAALREPMHSHEQLIMTSLKDTQLQEHFYAFFCRGSLGDHCKVYIEILNVHGELILRHLM